jgi:hypothetical protein
MQVTPKILGLFATVKRVHMFLISNKPGGTPWSEFILGTISWLLLSPALDCLNVPQWLIDNGTVNSQESLPASAATFQAYKSSSMKIFRNKRLSRLAAGWTVQVSKPTWVRFSVPVQTDDTVHPVLYSEYRIYPGKSRRRLVLTTNPLLATRLRNAESYTTAFPLCLHRHVMGWSLPLPILS